ncbi:hypothetical protein H4R27_005224 [Coemansia aciculifera]|nr:hypothetical protein H4R27_005224 [Coemansia aciculifera]
MELDPLVPKPPKVVGAATSLPLPLTDTNVNESADDLPRPEAQAHVEATVDGRPLANDSGSPHSIDAEAMDSSSRDSSSLATQAVPQAEPAADTGHREDKGPSTPPAVSACVQAKSPVRTEYAMSRPQRSHARPVALRYEDPHQMVRCTPFQGQPLSGVSGSQPFRLVVHTNAQLQMDFHAHLMLSEVIGLLGGRWDATNKVLTVTRAFPCAALESEDAHTNVEMDPGSELVVRHQIMDAGLRVVGWYHSHPTFRPDPSIIDIENQTAYQTLFRDNDGSEEPFVGAIVGPYDPELPGPVSVFNWFYVGKSVVDRGHPKRLVVEPMSDTVLPVEEQEMLLHLLDTTCGHQHCAALEEAWRPSSTELRSLKMAVSLARRMPWLLAPAEGSDESTPAQSLAVSPGVPSCDASDCTAASDPTPATMPMALSLPSAERDAEFESIDKQIPAADLLAGKRAVQDPLLTALSSRFSAGVFKTGPDGRLADAQALERKPVLYTYFRSSASARVRIALNLKGIVYESRPVNLVQGEQRSADYFALNPSGLVPSLEIDGHRLTQSVAILEYLEETRKNRPLLPSDPLQRARVRAIVGAICCDTQPLQNLRVLLELPESERAGHARSVISQGLAVVEKMLEHTAGRFCVGDEVTLADCCLIPQLYNAHRYAVDFAALPRIREIEERAAALDAFHRAHWSQQPDCPTNIRSD